MSIIQKYLEWLMGILLMLILTLALGLPWLINAFAYKVLILRNHVQGTWKKKVWIACKKIVQGYCPEKSKIVLVTTKDDRGKFGRILGDFKVYDAKVDAWLMLSDVLINGGFAVRYHGQSKEEIKEAHFFNREKVRGLLAE